MSIQDRERASKLIAAAKTVAVIQPVTKATSKMDLDAVEAALKRTNGIGTLIVIVAS